ncbi:MAG: hypothetical protein RR975_04990 [Clostridia bacterium]
MANVFVKNKKNGVTYVYQSESYWDKEKKQSRSKRVCIGKLDENSEFVSSKRFEKPLPVISQSADAVTKEAKRRFYGATYLLDSIGRQTGVSADLKVCNANAEWSMNSGHIQWGSKLPSNRTVVNAKFS